MDFLEEDDVNVTGYSLVLPSVSVGNVGQLAVDLLLHNLPVRLLAAFSHPSLQPLVGMLPDGGDHLMTAVEAFVCESKKLVIVQIRSPISLKGRLSFVSGLLDWAHSRGVTSVVQLASSHASTRADPAEPLLSRLSTSAAETDALEKLVPRQAADGTDVIPGAGFVHDFYRACEDRQLPYTCLLRHTYEGNNTPEAVDLCNCLDSWLGLLQKDTAVRPGPLGKWRLPPTWSHLFGTALDRRLFW